MQVISSESSGTQTAERVINPISPMFYVELQTGPGIVNALIDSGASENFISDRVARELCLKRHRLHEGQTFTAASGDAIPWTEFVHVHVTMHTIRFYMNLRVAPMHPDLILAIPFLQRFNRLINWQERSFRVHRRDGTHWIPIVQKLPYRSAASVAFPHDPTHVTATGGITFTEWEEPTE